MVKPGLVIHLTPRIITIIVCLLFFCSGASNFVSGQSGTSNSNATLCAGPTNLIVNWTFIEVENSYEIQISECDQSVNKNYTLEVLNMDQLDDQGSPSTFITISPNDLNQPVFLADVGVVKWRVCPIYQFNVIHGVVMAADNGGSWAETFGTLASCSMVFGGVDDRSEIYNCSTLSADSGLVEIIDKKVNSEFTSGCLFPIYSDLEDPASGELTLTWERVDTSNLAEGPWVEQFYIYKYNHNNSTVDLVLDKKETKNWDIPIVNDSDRDTFSKKNFDSQPVSYGSFGELGNWQLTIFIGYKNGVGGTQYQARLKDRSSDQFDRLLSGGVHTPNYTNLTDNELVVSRLDFHSVTSTSTIPGLTTTICEESNLADPVMETDPWTNNMLKGKVRNSALAKDYYASLNYEFEITMTQACQNKAFYVFFDAYRIVNAYVAGAWLQLPPDFPDNVYSGSCDSTPKCVFDWADPIILEGSWDPRAYVDKGSGSRPTFQQAGGAHSALYKVTYSVEWCTASVPLVSCVNNNQLDNLETEVLII